LRLLAVVFLLFTTVFLAAVPALADGTIRGTVTDKESGEELIGVDLVLVGTGQAAMSDIDGKFVFADLAAGTYELRLTYLGYNTKFLAGLDLAAGHTLDLDIKMESFRAHQAEGMTISAGRVLSTDSALLADRRNSAVIGDAISSAQISRSPDGTSGDALRRVPGLTVNEGKYVFVRGVTDRYNVTEVNGVAMSGANVDRDRKSFNFDMIPANLLANVVVVKSATPDLPGDFSGGLVRITTLEFPEKATTAVGFSAGHTGRTTGEDFGLDAVVGSTDWLGIDDGGRAFPSEELENNTWDAFAGVRNQDLARALSNRWTTQTKQAPPKLSFNLSHGNQVGALGGSLGYMAAVSYRNKYVTAEEDEQRQLDENGQGTELSTEGKSSHFQTTWGGLANIFWRKGGHRLGFSNSYNRSGNSDVSFTTGQDGDKSFVRQNIEWQERYQFVNKLDGVHHLPGPKQGFDFDWMAFYGESHATEPDRRYLEYNLDFDPARMNENMRSWSWLDEDRRGIAANLAWSPAEDDFEKRYNPEFKVGYRKDNRERAYDVEAWYTIGSFFTNGEFYSYAPDTIFAPENYNEVSDPRRGQGWEFAQESRFAGSYDARQDVEAYYGMADLPFAVFQEDFRLTGGARVEDSDQFVEALTTKDPSVPDPVETAQVANKDVLPSVSLTWAYDEKTNFRAGYYESVNRPEFREMAPVLRRNFKTFQNELGNPNLKRAEITNYDVRMEYFPDYGEVAALSGFYKQFIDAIEDSLMSEATRPTLTWSNAPRADNWGFEVELRKKLDFWTPLEDLTVAANYTRVWSEVEYKDSAGNDQTRPLQGQAPWSINASLLYDNPNSGTAVNLLYNSVGRRLWQVADFEHLNIYLEPRNKLDLVVTQKLSRHLKIKAAAKDILAEDFVKTSGTLDNPYEYSRITWGTEYTLGVSGRF
jgi:TonB-dependent receptor